MTMRCMLNAAWATRAMASGSDAARWNLHLLDGHDVPPHAEPVHEPAVGAGGAAVGEEGVPVTVELLLTG